MRDSYECERLQVIKMHAEVRAGLFAPAIVSRSEPLVGCLVESRSSSETVNIGIKAASKQHRNHI